MNQVLRALLMIRNKNGLHILFIDAYTSIFNRPTIHYVYIRMRIYCIIDSVNLLYGSVDNICCSLLAWISDYERLSICYAKAYLFLYKYVNIFMNLL